MEAAQAAEFAEAFAEFRSLIDADWIDAQQPMGPATVYTAAVTTWLLVYQRMHGGASLSDAVGELLHNHPQFLPDNKRVREGRLSANTGAYSQARQRLDPKITVGVADHVFRSLISAVPPSVAGRRAFLLDGTTIALSSSDKLRQRFPPASNQYGEGVWPIAHLVVAHELETGCAILPEVGTKFGSQAESEVRLAQALLPRLPARSIVIADRNFGVFSLVHAAHEADHDAVVRLTEQRFKALLKKAQPMAGDDPQRAPCVSRWQVSWRPTQQDRKTNPDLPPDAKIDAILHQVPVSKELTLWLLTTWDCPSDTAARLYGRRQEIETDIRQIKVLLNIEQLPARDETMIRKELATSIVAYNLVIQIRRLAAKKAGVPPKKISFARTWSAVRIVLLESSDGSANDWLQRFQLALRMVGQAKLPNRPGRSYPRRAHTKRNKSTSGQRTPFKKTK